MKIKITTNEENKTVHVRFGDLSVVLTEQEIQPFQRGEFRRAVFDISRVVVFDTWRLRVFEDNPPSNHTGAYKETAHLLPMNALKFLAALRVIHERNQARWQAFSERKAALGQQRDRYEIKEAEYYQKLDVLEKAFKGQRIEPTWELDRFRNEPVALPRLTVSQMAHHPNAKEGFAQALRRFHKYLSAECWAKMTETLSRYLTMARIFGHCGCRLEHDVEFYFDGRFSGGCGFNGAMILRVDGEQALPGTASFSIHT
jgi:hypothetical protein